MPLEQVYIQEYKKVQDVRDRMLAADPYAGSLPANLQQDPEIKAMGLNGPKNSWAEHQLQSALSYRFDKGVITGYTPLDLGGSNPILNATISRTNDKGEPIFVSLREGLRGLKLGVYEVKVTETPIASPSVSVNAAPQTPQTMEVYVGILDKEDLENTLKYDSEHPSPGQNFKLNTEVLDDTAIPVELYVNKSGSVLAVLDKAPPQPLIFPDVPEFGLYENTPSEVAQDYKNQNMGDLKTEGMDWAVKERNGLVDLEHFRREAFLALQKLRTEQLAKYPLDPADAGSIPPQMLQTDEFKATGLRLSNQADQGLLFRALNYKPEGAVVSGYHPIDYAKDKAANYVVLVPGAGSNIGVFTLKEEFEGKPHTLAKLRLQPATGQKGNTIDTYYGPCTDTQLDAIRKSNDKVQITELKDQDVPLTLYTNDKGDLAFVMGFRPKDVLLVSPEPGILVLDEPIEKVKAVVAQGPTAVSSALGAWHHTLAGFALIAH